MAKTTHSFKFFGGLRRRSDLLGTGLAGDCAAAGETSDHQSG